MSFSDFSSFSIRPSTVLAAIALPVALDPVVASASQTTGAPRRLHRIGSPGLRHAATAARSRLARVTMEQFGQPDEEHPREKQRGPVILRRSRRDESTTTDQRLLDSRGPAGWVRPDPWRVLRIQAEFVEGFGALAEVPRAVTVFGSARTKRDHAEYQLGMDIGAGPARAGYAGMTGGGPGSMEAVNRGCSEAGGLSIGLGIELPVEQGLNPWVGLGGNVRFFSPPRTRVVE